MGRRLRSFDWAALSGAALADVEATRTMSGNRLEGERSDRMIVITDDYCVSCRS